MLLFHLRKSGYFGPEVGANPRVLNEVEKRIGRVLHRLVLVSYRNTHQFSEMESWNNSEGVKLAPLGSAMNPTLALMNHSCDPNTIRCNIGTKTFVVATKNIKAGTEITDTYSVHYQDVDCQKRQQHLMDNYGFECGCRACYGRWPTYDGLRKSVACPGVPAARIEEAKKMFMSLTALTNKDLQSGYFDRIIDMWKGYYSGLEQVLQPPHKCFLRVHSMVMDCIWLKYGNRVPKLNAPIYKNHKEKAEQEEGVDKQRGKKK